MKHSWTGVIRGIREQARTAYARSLCLSQRVRYVQSCLLAKIWYIAQIIPQTTTQAQQITAVSTGFIWQGAIFRIPVMSLHRPKEEGGWGFPNIHAKCRTLLYNRIQMMGESDRTVISTHMDLLKLTHIMIPSKLPQIRQYARDTAYILPDNESDTRKTFKRRIYEVLGNRDLAKYGIQEPRIVRNNPGIPWRRIWTSLHSPVVPEMVKSAWFAAIHDIVPTNDRLASIHLANTSSCARCGEVDFIQNKITECMEGQIIWNWTRSKLGKILRMDTRHIPPDWPIRPAFHYWPPQRQSALIWIMAHLVYHRLQSHKRQSLHDFMDFLKRARWKTYHRSTRRPMGRYLDIL